LDSRIGQGKPLINDTPPAGKAAGPPEPRRSPFHQIQDSVISTPDTSLSLPTTSRNFDSFLAKNRQARPKVKVLVTKKAA
jgi:hypothetical protein